MKLESRRGEELKRLAAQQDVFERGLTQRQPEDSEQEINRKFRREIERYLDRSAGQCFLAQTPIADLVANAIQFFKGPKVSVARLGRDAEPRARSSLADAK